MIKFKDDNTLNWNYTHTTLTYQQMIQLNKREDLYNIKNNINLFNTTFIQGEYFKIQKFQEFEVAQNIFINHINEIQRQNKNNLSHFNLYVSLYSDNKIKIREKGSDKFTSLKTIWKEYYLNGYYINYIAVNNNNETIQEMIDNNIILKKVISCITNRSKYYTFDYLSSLKEYLAQFNIITNTVQDNILNSNISKKIQYYDNLCNACSKTGELWSFYHNELDHNLKQFNIMIEFKKWYFINQDNLSKVNVKGGTRFDYLISEFSKYFENKNICTCGKKLKVDRTVLNDFLSGVYWK